MTAHAEGLAPGRQATVITTPLPGERRGQRLTQPPQMLTPPRIPGPSLILTLRRGLLISPLQAPPRVGWQQPSLQWALATSIHVPCASPAGWLGAGHSTSQQERHTGPAYLPHTAPSVQQLSPSSNSAHRDAMATSGDCSLGWPHARPFTQAAAGLRVGRGHRLGLGCFMTEQSHLCHV